MLVLGHLICTMCARIETYDIKRGNATEIKFSAPEGSRFPAAITLSMGHDFWVEGALVVLVRTQGSWTT